MKAGEPIFTASDERRATIFDGLTGRFRPSSREPRSAFDPIQVSPILGVWSAPVRLHRLMLSLIWTAVPTS